MENTGKTRPQAGKKARKPALATEPQSTPRMRKIVLTKVAHVRAELGKLYTEARHGLIDVADASKLANMLGILHRILADSDLEQRITALEEMKR